MYCRHCGKSIADDSSFCQFCGGKVSSKSTVDNPSIQLQSESSITEELKKDNYDENTESFKPQHINTLKYVGIWSAVCLMVSILDYWEDGNYDGIDLFWWILIGSIIISICTNWKEICFYWKKKYPQKVKKTEGELHSNEFFKCPRCGDVISKSKISYYKSERTKYSFSGRWMVTKSFEHYEPMCEKCTSFRNKADNIINGIVCLNMIICIVVFLVGGVIDNIILAKADRLSARGEAVTDEMVESARKIAKDEFDLNDGDLIVVTGGFPLGKSKKTNYLRIIEV